MFCYEMKGKLIIHIIFLRDNIQSQHYEKLNKSDSNFAADIIKGLKNKIGKNSERTD